MNLKRSATAAVAALAFAATAFAAPGATLELPAGTRATVYASGFTKARFMAFAPNGDLFLSDTGAGRVLVLPDRNHDGRADGTRVFASGLNQPHGLAFHGGSLYVANTDAVVRFPYRAGDERATAAPVTLVRLPSGAGHSTRTIVFGPDDRMYVSVGSSCNVCEESDARRAAVWSYDADGRDGRPFATGLRNAVGLAWHNGALYATSNGRDWLGDDLPPEGVFRLEAGGFYGWPYCYTVNGRQVWDRDFARRDQAFCDTAKPAVATTTAHSAPLGLAFLDHASIPAAYRGLALVALHGSWNRSTRSGYKLVLVNVSNGEVRDFATGFVRNGAVVGRPVDVVVAPDGSVFVSDDFANVVYHVTFGA